MKISDLMPSKPEPSKPFKPIKPLPLLCREKFAAHMLKQSEKNAKRNFDAMKKDAQKQQKPTFDIPQTSS